jgi:CubicO group peptidase (beta-lactamase class C family)
MLYLLFLLILSAAEPDSAAVDRLVTDSLKAWKVPGAAVVVVRGEETLILKGYGSRRLGKPNPVTADTIFPLASCSKAFTTTLLAMLADDGQIAWDDPIRKHLPDFRLPDRNVDALVRMRDLLCHRSGIGSHDLLWYRAPWGIDEIIRRVQLLPLSYPFRSGYQYSSIPFLVAGRALEKRTGENWDKLVKTRITDALGMKGVTFTTIDIHADADRAGGHRLDKWGRVESMATYEIEVPNPSGSVNATPRDLVYWLKFHLTRGVGPDGKRLVSVKNLTETHTPQNLIPMRGSARTLNPDTVQLAYGMGWLIYDYRGKKVISHGGMIDGFRVQITFLPDDDLGVAILCNLHETKMTNALTNALVDLYTGLEDKDWTAYYRNVVDDEAAERKRDLSARERLRDRQAPMSLRATGYAGNYEHPAFGTARVTATGDKLTVKYGAFDCALEHFEKDTFRVTGGFFEDRLVSFEVTNGRAALVKFEGHEFVKRE